MNLCNRTTSFDALAINLVEFSVQVVYIYVGELVVLYTEDI